MKIALNMGGDANDPKAAQKVLERDILAAKDGDWNAKGNLARVFMPLLTSLAEKRTKDPARLNRCVEAGKQGLFHAARKYKSSMGPDHFRVFALDFIEQSMDRAVKAEETGPGQGGLLSRLFGR
jgi:DNA-directed RNA polymerase sigma subunit (sigma70/sigma32)